MAKTLQQIRDEVKLPLSKQIVESMIANQEEIVVSFLCDAAYLNSKEEWDMDDNFSTTEGIVDTASRVTALTAGEEEVAAWVEIAKLFGYDNEDLGIEPDEDDDEDELGDEEEWDG